jgi:hypothetical protein
VLLYSSTICRCRWWLHQPPPHRFSLSRLSPLCWARAQHR